MPDMPDMPARSSRPAAAPDWSALAPVLVVCAGVCWGCISLFSVPLASLGLAPLQIATVRSGIAAVLLGAILAVSNRGALRIRLRDVWMFVGSGVASIALFNVCYFACISECGAGLAAILLYTAPFFVVVMSAIFFSERLTPVKIAALAVAFGGCLLVCGIGPLGGALPAWGIAVGLGSGIGYALYSIFGRFALRAGYGQWTLIFWTFVFSALATAPFAHVGEIAAIAVSSPRAMALMVGLAAVSTLAPFALYTTGLAHMETGRASIMAFVEPAVALVVGVVVFGETLSATNVVGIALIAAAVVMLGVRRE